MADKPSILFVCVKNGGKSQMAEALMRQLADDAGAPIDVDSAGTKPGQALNELSADAVAEVGADMRAGHAPRGIDPAALAAADRVVLLGQEVELDPTLPSGPVDRWETVEPSQDGVEGMPRMRLIRDDIRARCQALLEELTS